MATAGLKSGSVVTLPGSNKRTAGDLDQAYVQLQRYAIALKAAAVLKRRTLTNHYNERSTWLANAHSDLDAVLAAAYGWPADLIGRPDPRAPVQTQPGVRGIAGRLTL